MDNELMVLFGNSLPQTLIGTNEQTQKYGLTLSQADVAKIVEGQKYILSEQSRVELDGTITAKIILEFCDSDFIEQDDYADTIIRLLDIYYLYKNETNNKMSDEEVIHLMKEQFELLCFGDLDYLEYDCLPRYADAVRCGHTGFTENAGKKECFKFDREKRWDSELFYETLKERMGW